MFRHFSQLHETRQPATFGRQGQGNIKHWGNDRRAGLMQRAEHGVQNIQIPSPLSA